MKRAEATALVREIMERCKSFHSAESVSVDQTGDDCILSIKWVPDYAELSCLEEIAEKHGTAMKLKEKKTIFGLALES